MQIDSLEGLGLVIAVVGLAICLGLVALGVALARIARAIELWQRGPQRFGCGYLLDELAVDDPLGAADGGAL